MDQSSAGFAGGLRRGLTQAELAVEEGIALEVDARGHVTFEERSGPGLAPPAVRVGAGREALGVLQPQGSLSK